jgi:hypothetical protein
LIERFKQCNEEGLPLCPEQAFLLLWATFPFYQELQCSERPQLRGFYLVQIEDKDSLWFLL